MAARIYDALVTTLGATIRRQTLRRHWPFGVVLVAGLALRVAAMLAYRPALVYIDTVRYLGGDQHGLDPLGYSYLLLRPVLLAGGGLAGVAAVQHALGVAMAVSMYALAIRLGLSRWLAVIASAPVLLDAYQVQAEQMIMPDVLFESLIVAAVAVLLRRPDPGLARLAGGSALLGASASVRQVGEVLVLPLLGFTLAATRGWRQRAVRAAVTTAVFALPVVGYMALSAAVLGNGFRLSNMDDAYLYGRVAHAADCAALHVPAYERPLCPSPATAATLGVDGLATNPRSEVFSYRPPAGLTRGQAALRFDEAVLTQQPLRVAGDVASDAIKVFALTRNTTHPDPPVSRWQFQLRYPVYYGVDYSVRGGGVGTRGGGVGTPGGGVGERGGGVGTRGGGVGTRGGGVGTRGGGVGTRGGGVGTRGGGTGALGGGTGALGGVSGFRPQVVVPLADVLRAYQLHGGFTPGPLLLVLLLLGTGGCLSLRRHRRLGLGCVLATGLAVAAVLGADLYEFSWRYQLPALVTLPLAGALGAVWFFGVVRRGLLPLSSRAIRLAVTRWSEGQGRMIRWTLTRLSPPTRRSARSRAASSTATNGSGCDATTSSDATVRAERTPS